MPKNFSDECKVEAKELKKPLEKVQQAREESQIQLEELQLYLSELKRDTKLIGLESVRRAGELLELWGQLGDVVSKPTLGNILATWGKTVSVCAEAIINDLREQNLAEAQAKRLQLLERKLDLAIRKELADAEEVREKLDAFWKCSEKYEPREVEIEIKVSLHEAKGTPSLGTTLDFNFHCTGRVQLVELDEELSSFKDRLAWVCREPQCERHYQGSGKVDYVLDRYNIKYNAPKITVKKQSFVVTGGPLECSVFVTWKRFVPTILSMGSIQFVEPSAPLEVKLNTELLVDGSSKSYPRSMYPAKQINLMLAMALGSANRMFRPIPVKGPPHRWTYNISDKKLQFPDIPSRIGSLSMSVAITP